MTEPITVNRSFIIPNTSDLPGAWGTSALNPNFQSIDTLFGGVTTITLSTATTILLSVPATTGIWPGGNPSQSMNALIRFTGVQSASATIQFTLPGFYIIDNQCTGGFSTRLQPSNLTGNCVGAINGKKHHVFYDGVHMDYVDMPDPGTAIDLNTNTTTLPPWMTACTVSPYLIKDGSTYSSAIYPALAQLLGSTYGGNGVTTFGVPDERARVRLGVDTIQAASAATSARITGASGGFNGSVLGTSGGTSAITLITANLPPYTPSGSVTTNPAFLVGESLPSLSPSGVTQVLATPITLNGNLTFTGNAQGGTSTPFTNVEPAIVSMLPLIKT